MMDELPEDWTGTPYEEQGAVVQEYVELLERLDAEMADSDEPMYRPGSADARRVVQAESRKEAHVVIHRGAHARTTSSRRQHGRARVQ